MRDIHKIVEHNGYNINIIRDSDPQSPRDWGSLGTMYTMHRRYQPEKSFSDHFEWEEVFDRNRDLLSSFEERYIALKFYLYDHGGQSVSTTPFSCGWDSGLFGIIAVEVDKVKEEYGWKRITKERREKIEGYLGGEVELYNQYLAGEVYGYTITECDNEENELDHSCWGFFGDDGIEQLVDEAKGYIEAHLEDPKIIKRNQIFDQIKQFAKELLTAEGIEAELKLTF